MNGALSMSPMVPPTSVMTKSKTSPDSSVANEGFAPLCGAAAILMAAPKTPVASEGGEGLRADDSGRPSSPLGRSGEVFIILLFISSVMCGTT